MSFASSQQIKQLFVTLIMALSLHPVACLAAADQPDEVQLDHSQAQGIMRAVGHILLRQQMTSELIDACITSHPHLKHSAEQSLQTWQVTHIKTIERTKRVQEIVLRYVQKAQSEQVAEKLKLDVQNIIHNSVQEFKNDLAKKSQKDRHYVCNRLILSISSGDWDLQQQVPDSVKLITEFK